ncbi:sprT-like domain-containing protein Spartan [Odontomachus brunneus]|uniref:sprT-like domain-containing protein Spartan n=1 Tax=Odontomachus brunneus TaxID=486640 RepID=UPI0013F188A0|nr:sprT-like domain-containing protein Spartan [Odontomachus brunneus]
MYKEEYRDMNQIRGFTIWWGQGMHSSSGLTQFEYRYIKISRTIQDYLSKKELMETILHEMIHAWLFCREKLLKFCLYHGGLFVQKMEWINRRGGWNVTVDHLTADDTPPLFDRHVWRCLDCGHEMRLRTNRTLPDLWYGQHKPYRTQRWKRVKRAAKV